MTKGIKEGEPGGREIYPDIIDHPHWQSPTRPHMSLQDRAAQFSPFDALTGYADMVREEQRFTDEQAELDENSLQALDQKMAGIAADLAAGKHPVITVTCFVPDLHKSGGSYRTITGTAEKIDITRRELILRPEADPRGEIEAVGFDTIADLS